MKNRKIKLLIFITDFDITGGAQMMLLNLLSKIDRSKFNVVLASLASLKNSTGYAVNVLRQRGERLIELKMRNKFDFFVLFRFCKLIKHEKPDILYSVLFHPNIISRVIGKFLCRVPIVINGQRSTDLWRRLPHTLLDRRTFKWCDHTIALSESAKKRLLKIEKLEPKKISVVYNGIDFEKFDVSRAEARKKIFDFIEKEDSGQTLIGSVSRLHSSKGLNYAVEAVTSMREKFDNVLYVIVGEGKEQESLQKLIKDKGAGEYILLAGEKRDINEFLSGFDIFLLPSIIEGFGNIFLEAQAAGVPIIATKEGGIPEAVEDGVTAILVEKKSVLQIEEALSVLLDAPELRKKMGMAGKKRVRNKFSIEQMTARNEEIFLRLYNERNNN